MMWWWLAIFSFGNAILSTCGNDEPSRQWICNKSSKCVLKKDDYETNPITAYETQNICRLSCGRYGSLWPRPTGATLISNGRLKFDPRNTRLDLSSSHSSVRNFLNNIFFIYMENVMKECDHNCTLPSSTEVLIRISVNSSRLRLTWDTDESYNLVITPSDSLVLVTIKSVSVFGARHGLETLSQLITGPYHTDSGAVMVSSARVKDRPVYRHRGLLLDTSRNFIPVDNIEKTIDAMASSKLNVFHWHATDSHSFPLEIPKVSEMQSFGAYSESNKYSAEDIKYIIEYARNRGIRVIIELDAPSHAGNGWQWGQQAGLGNLAVCVNKQPWRNYCIQPPCGQLNPVNENLYSVLRAIYEDLDEYLPPDETIHMGGDEVHFGCWNSSEEIVNHLHERGLDTSPQNFLDLWSNFQTRNLGIWDSIKGRTALSNFRSIQTNVIIWSSHLTDPEIIERYLPNNRYIIQTWVESSNSLVTTLLSKGYKIIASTKDAWYLDHGFWGSTKYYNWKLVYNNRLQRKPGVLGGEACMWSEYVDENSLDSRIWPRAGAVAERLWTDPETDAILSEPRFFRFRERLISRGLRPDAITPKWCTINEGNCL